MCAHACVSVCVVSSSDLARQWSVCVLRSACVPLDKSAFFSFFLSVFSRSCTGCGSRLLIAAVAAVAASVTAVPEECWRPRPSSPQSQRGVGAAGRRLGMKARGCKQATQTNEGSARPAEPPSPAYPPPFSPPPPYTSGRDSDSHCDGPPAQH